MNRIVSDSGVHFGKPCVANTRITVQNVLELLGEGRTFKEITQDYYPDLTVEDIRACIQYAIAIVTAEKVHLAPVRSGVENELRPEYNLPQLLKDGTHGKYAADYQKGISAEMNESVIPTVIEQVQALPDDAQREILEFPQTLRTTMQRGTPGKQLLRFAGVVQADDLARMQQAIESSCEQIDANAW